MEKCFLTNGGNLLRVHSTQKFYFQKPSGEFIREVSNSEAEFLYGVTLEIDVHNPPSEPEFLPTWHFIKSVLVLDNYSNYRAETSCNGGDYSFSTWHDWYVAKYPDGSWKFAFVERHTTSAEFSYDELAGSFQSDLGDLYIKNAGEYCPCYSSQSGIEWIETGESFTSPRGVVQKKQEKFYTSSEVLEKIGTISTFEHLWNEVFEYIPSKWDEDDEGYTSPALSFSNKKEVISRLKELGVTRQDKKPSLRGQRRGGGRRR